jgi:hypothetical protein
LTTVTNKEWQKEFGIGDGGVKLFYSNKSELTAVGPQASQAHVLRRAFDLLKLDGVFCTENTPLIYFKQVKRIEAEEVARVHRKFWNHGGAPILVLVAPHEVHVYSGLVRPTAQADRVGHIPSLVETLNRTSSALREFLPAVESGEFFRRHQKSFNPA